METNIIEQGQARLGITWNGQYGELPDTVFFEATDADLRRFATEAVTGGSVPGIGADTNADFTDFVVERFSPTADRPYSIIQLRPKTPFGVWR